MSSTALLNPALPSSWALWPLLRRFLWAYLLTAAALVLFGLQWGEAGYDMLVVAMGWPHVILGFVFYFHKVLNKEGPHRFYFSLLLGITLAICWVHYLNPITTLIYLYFVFHAFRDEIFIYHQRRTGHRFQGPVFNLAGWLLLAAALSLSASDQLGFSRTIRQGELDLGSLREGRGELHVRFEPIPDSQGRRFYFYLVAPGSEGSFALRTFGWRQDRLPEGRLLVSDRPWRLSDLALTPLYWGEEKAPVAASGEALLLTGGHKVGQTLVAQADGLSGFTLPLELAGDLPAGVRLRYSLEAGWFAGHPFLDDWLLLGLVAVASLLAWGGFPAGVFGRFPEVRYFLPILALFLGAKLGLQLWRHYLGLGPLFFTFLVVFHYFSWYVFSLEKIEARPARAFQPSSGWERFLATISTRSGFLQVVLLLNFLSFLGVYVYHQVISLPYLKYFFDLRYFLFVLVFHVTMSFAPKKAFQKASA